MRAIMDGGKLVRAHRIRGALGELFGQASVPMIVIDRDARFVAANDSAVQQYGYSLEELLELSIPDLQTNQWSPSNVERAFAGDSVEPGRRAHRRKDGTIVWVVPKPCRVTVDGEPLVAAILQDITALVTAEDVARVSRERETVVWDAAVERATRSFALLDADCRIVRANSPMQRRTQRAEGALIGKFCREVFLGRCTREPCPHQIALAEHRLVVEEITTHSGRPFRVEVWPAAPNEAGIALVHVGEDLTEEHALRSRLLTADRLANLGRVMAAVAHEVNNPAGFVLLALPLIRDCIVQRRTDEALSLVENAREAMMQIAAIMRDLRGFGRDYPRSVVDLAALANGALRIAAYEAEPRAHIERVFEEGVAADVRGGRVAQVILNLVLNAAQAIPPGNPTRHRIEIRVSRAEDRAVLEVADSGTGVPEEIGDRIFEPFFTTRGEQGGTGLGLWLSRTIVEEEGGTLTWRNGTPAGAVFTVSLPLEQQGSPSPGAVAE
jgi:PAS domain S-box-containing protein